MMVLTGDRKQIGVRSRGRRAPMLRDAGRNAVRAQIASTDRVPRRGVADELDHDDFRAGPDRSDSHSGQSDDRIIAQGGDCFQGHVAGALNRPFIVLLKQDGAD